MTMVVVMVAMGVMAEVAVAYVSTNAGMETVGAILVLTEVHAVLEATPPGVGGQADRCYKSEHQHTGKRPDAAHVRPGHVLCSFCRKQEWCIEENT